MSEEGDTKYTVKFSASSGLYGFVRATFIAMRLLAMVGLNVAPVKLVTAANLRQTFPRNQKQSFKVPTKGRIVYITMRNS